MKVLCKHFGFSVSRQSGSHLILARVFTGEKQAIPVPLHPEIGRGLLARILKEAGISRVEFMEALEKG